MLETSNNIETMILVIAVLKSDNEYTTLLLIHGPFAFLNHIEWVRLYVLMALLAFIMSQFDLK